LKVGGDVSRSLFGSGTLELYRVIVPNCQRSIAAMSIRRNSRLSSVILRKVGHRPLTLRVSSPYYHDQPDCRHFRRPTLPGFGPGVKQRLPAGFRNRTRQSARNAKRKRRRNHG